MYLCIYVSGNLGVKQKLNLKTEYIEVDFNYVLEKFLQYSVNLFSIQKPSRKNQDNNGARIYH